MTSLSLEQRLARVKTEEDYRRLLLEGLEEYVTRDNEKYLINAAREGYLSHRSYEDRKVKSTLSYIANGLKIAPHKPVPHPISTILFFCSEKCGVSH